MWSNLSRGMDLYQRLFLCTALRRTDWSSLCVYFSYRNCEELFHAWHNSRRQWKYYTLWTSYFSRALPYFISPSSKHISSVPFTPTSTTHPLLHRTAAQLGKHPNAKTRIQNIYETEHHSGSTDVTYTSVTKTHGHLNPLPMVIVMPAKLFIINILIMIIITTTTAATATTTTTTIYLCTFNCVLHKGQVHTIRPGGCCLLAFVQGSKQRYKLKDDLKHSDAY